MFIINAIKKIKNSKRTLFTTPAHLQSSIIPAGLKNLIGYKAYQADFSEVEGLDNLKKPENCILKSQDKTSKIYNTKQTFYLTNGSSSGILAIMLTVLKENDKVLIARNAHESIFNGLVLTGARPVWFLPDYDEKFDIAKGITLKQIQNEYEKSKDIKALIITSPTYEGMVSEIKEIANFCKEKNIFFIVDEAHGALFGFHDKLPESSISLGADACVQSLHKNTPSLTGTALLHLSKTTKINSFDIQRNLNLITTTSPSWLLIASIEGAIEYLNSSKCKKDIDKLINNIENLKNNNSDFEFLTNQNYDITKLLISKKGFSGEELSDFLFENNIEDELVTSNSVLCLCGIGTTDKKFKKLNKVLNKFNKKPLNNINKFDFSLPVMKMIPKEAYNSEYKIIEKNNSVGKIIAENITPYPPCVPILMSGEIIEEKHLKYLNDKIQIIRKDL
ncbi:MAG: aminotransferase class I/II-fold pyridoxal phosphate-dependent enzyme [Candidatus Gastranaerophilales bacterium]|nr:aminotransferase class I/II-fold pyridoxal phosphate-dependent enzyme [Candidatus Gastranaerophilales bacterium]